MCTSGRTTLWICDFAFAQTRAKSVALGHVFEIEKAGIRKRERRNLLAGIPGMSLAGILHKR
jgi:hypothetical protein